MKIVHISDTHEKELLLSARGLIPDGDVLVHSGDFGGREDGSLLEFLYFIEWLGTQPHKHKIYVSGNHDAYPVSNIIDARRMFLDHGIVYLHNESVMIENVLFTGLSLHFPEEWTKASKMAITAPVLVNSPQSKDLHHEVGAQVIISHCPPLGAGDSPLFPGSKDLARQIALFRPELVLCGHIHEGRGITELHWEGDSLPAQDTLPESPLMARSEILSSRKALEGSSVVLHSAKNATLIVNAAALTRGCLSRAVEIEVSSGK
jgi:Icc-related predicted phosphoesterase